jgi:hypothetical protein
MRGLSEMFGCRFFIVSQVCGWACGVGWVGRWVEGKKCV